ncbi:brachyurin [Ceratitis capitata]|uniref:brachyurin n=1 Tax=Ceratitis capitata TaxID=7213 RepID=UPI000329FB44|nr:brachyurin [Ceratitis capitata]
MAQLALTLLIVATFGLRASTVALPTSLREMHRTYFGAGDFEFWYWDLAWLVWDKQCSKYNISRTVDTRITGGELAEPNMFPYQVGLLLLRAPKIYQCGGTLISVSYVLTAAHCIYKSTCGKVFLGSIDFANPFTAAAVYNVSESDLIVYEKYTLSGGRDDIGLIRLPTPAKLSSAVQIIPLAPRFMTQSFLQGKIVTTSGWGLTRDADMDKMEFNLLLYYVDAPVMAQGECACYYLPGLVRSRNHICASGAGGRGSCDGDSGGPLTYYYGNKSYLIGLTAFGSAGGCEIGFPSVYTRVATYLDWIAARTGIKVD